MRSVMKQGSATNKHRKSVMEEAPSDAVCSLSEKKFVFRNGRHHHEFVLLFSGC